MARDGERRVRVQRSVGPVVESNGELGTKTSGFLHPVAQDARRGHDEASALESPEGLERFAEAHVVGEQRSQLGASQKDEPVDALALIVSKLGPKLRSDGSFGERVEGLEERAECFEAWRRRHTERFGETREVGEGGRAESAVRTPRGEKIEERLPVIVEPVGGQRRVASADERHERTTLAPGGENGGGSGALPRARRERDVEPLALELEARSEPGVTTERLAGGSFHVDIGSFQLGDEVDGLLGGELLTPPEAQAEIPEQLRLEGALGVAIPKRDLAREGDEPVVLDAGPRRIAVDDTGENVERVPERTGLERKARRLLARARQAVRANVERNAPLAERGEHLADEKPDLLGAIHAAAAQLFPLATGELGLSPRAQHVSLADGAPDQTPTPRANAQEKTSTLGVDDEHGRDDGLGARAHGLAVERHRGDSSERRKELSHAVAGNDTPQPPGQRPLDLEVRGRRFEPGSVKGARGHRLERKRDRMKGLALDHPALEEEPLGNGAEAVEDRAFLP